jgi:hypothetical protein
MASVDLKYQIIGRQEAQAAKPQTVGVYRLAVLRLPLTVRSANGCSLLVALVDTRNPDFVGACIRACVVCVGSDIFVVLAWVCAGVCAGRVRVYPRCTHASG